jgi:hypothetical protein
MHVLSGRQERQNNGSEGQGGQDKSAKARVDGKPTRQKVTLPPDPGPGTCSTIKRGFRVLKSDIEIGPVHHRLPARIRAHAIICFLALVLYRVMPIRHGRQLMEQMNYNLMFRWFVGLGLARQAAWHVHATRGGRGISDQLPSYSD